MAVRTQRWKLIHPTGFGRETLPANIPFELYDIVADPWEAHNLAASEPAVLQTLRNDYAAWFADVSTTRPANFAPPRIVIGSDQETTTVLTRQEWRVPASGDNGREGKWLLRGERAANYTLELRWLKPVPAGSVAVTVGSTTRLVEVPTPTDRVSVDQLSLPSGDFDFSATHRSSTEREGVYHATLTRK
jgi:arylsulfatase/arylsulfatase A